MTAGALQHARERRIEIIKRRLLQKSSPRLQMLLILMLAGLAGFLTSFSLLHLHVFSMRLRYPIAILIAYGVFLLLLRVWLWVHGRRFNFNLRRVLDFIEPDPFDVLDLGGRADYAGGGPVGSWGQSVASTGGSSGSHGSTFDIGLDFDELWLIVIALIAIAAGLLASLYVVFIAPTLLAEILVDGVLMAVLYKRLAKIEPRHWLQTAFHKTVVPALLAAVFFSVAGYALQKAVPEAHSIAEVWKQIR